MELGQAALELAHSSERCYLWQVLSLAPHHADTRLALADVLTQLGMVDDALAVLRVEGGEEGEERGEGNMAVRGKELALLEGEERDLLQVGAADTAPPPLSGADWGARRACDSSNPLPPQDVRLKQQRFSLLAVEGRAGECAEVGSQLLIILFRDIYYRPDIKGIGSLLGT